MADKTDKKKLVVIGGGPGGYPAAFMAADRGLDVTLIDTKPNPGGVCLFQGCIPSKTLLHAAKIIHETRDAGRFGLDFGKPSIDIEKLRNWKDGVVKQLTGGLGSLSKSRHVHFLLGRGEFIDNRHVKVTLADGSEQTLDFDYAIIATGSAPTVIPGWPMDHEHVWNSTDALELPEVPDSLLIVGGGYIGLELGTVYSALGTKVSVVEMATQLIPAADEDLIQPLHKRLEAEFESIMLSTRVAEIEPVDDGVNVKLLSLDSAYPNRKYDKVLVSIGRKPMAEGIGLENTAVKIGSDGFIEHDASSRTAEPHIYAIGDVAGQPMLAHKATHEARIAVADLTGEPSKFDAQAIPAVVFTDPEVAWAGYSENDCRRDGVSYQVARFPWAASGRATSVGRNDGLTKIIFDPNTERILGVGIVGVGAGELIAEGVLAIEMGALASDLQMAIHAHPTFSETMMETAEAFHGSATHYIERKR